MWKEPRKGRLAGLTFHWDFAEFIPDFEGSARCAEVVRELDVYKDATSVFVTPDNGLAKIRQYCILDWPCCNRQMNPPTRKARGRLRGNDGPK